MSASMGNTVSMVIVHLGHQGSKVDPGMGDEIQASLPLEGGGGFLVHYRPAYRLQTLSVL